MPSAPSRPAAPLRRLAAPLRVLRMHHLRALLALGLALGAVVAITVTAPSTAQAAPRAPYTYGPLIEGYAGYVGQTLCSPSAKPGAAALAAMLLSTYPGTRSLGIVRACSVGGSSEHKEGRAFDWGVSAYSATGRAQVLDFVRFLAASDRYGNGHAMLRRLGIMYMIWNRHIWSASRASEGWRPYTGPNPHTDHVHISLSWAGANKASSYWTNKVGGVLTTAVPAPTTTPRPPTPTPSVPPASQGLPQPTVPTALPTGAGLPTSEVVTVPPSGTPTWTRYALTAGQRYLVDISGVVRWSRNAGDESDAECSRSAADPTWRRDRTVDARQPGQDHLDVYVAGQDMAGEPDTNAGDRCDADTHTYRWVYTPKRTGRHSFQMWDPTTYTDNSGSFVVRITRLGTPLPSTGTTQMVPAYARAGVTTPYELTGGTAYLLSATGTYTAPGGVAADAVCSRATSDASWSRTRSLLANEPGADHLNLLADRRPVTLTAVTDSGSGCDDAAHGYIGLLVPATTGHVNLRLDLPTGAGSGGVVVTVKPYTAPRGTETVTLDSTRAAGARTARLYRASTPVRIEATGAYAASPTVLADAECSASTTDPVWRRWRSGFVTADGTAAGDVTVGGRVQDWLPKVGGTGCDPRDHAYVLDYTVRADGVVPFALLDPSLADNRGAVTLTVTPTA